MLDLVCPHQGKFYLQVPSAGHLWHQLETNIHMSGDQRNHLVLNKQWPSGGAPVNCPHQQCLMGTNQGGSERYQDYQLLLDHQVAGHLVEGPQVYAIVTVMRMIGASGSHRATWTPTALRVMAMGSTAP